MNNGTKTIILCAAMTMASFLMYADNGDPMPKKALLFARRNTGSLSSTKDVPPAWIVASTGIIACAETGDASERLLSGHSIPSNVKQLGASGALALFSGETAEDAAFNKAAKMGDKESPLQRNTLFLHRSPKNEDDLFNDWQLLLTTGYNWRFADGMDEWCASRAQELKRCFLVERATFASDGRHIWLVCNTQSHTYLTVCAYNVENYEFRVLADGDTADEQPDGTILVKNRKTYLVDKEGNPLGAAWYDAWIAPDGKVVRKSEPRKELSAE